MPYLSTLPAPLENVDTWIQRDTAATQRRDLWRSIYQQCYKYAMPQRETFSWTTEGQDKNSLLFDSTLQENTYEAANTLCAVLFPPWTRWAELVPGGALQGAEIPENVLAGLQKSTETFFSFLNQSNFSTVINEAALDLMVGTAALSFDEGDNVQPFVFRALPTSLLGLEEGPFGTIETTFLCRKPRVRDLERMYPGLDAIDLPATVADAITANPEKLVEVLEIETWDPKTAQYYGLVLLKGEKEIIWRYGYGKTCPTIVARATKTAGEIYGRGRAMLALPDARTLDKMVEFVLRQAALQIAPPMTGVSDGVLNPYTARIVPNTVIPVASNDTGAPSLRVLEVGGDFGITEAMMSTMRERIRRTMLGPEMSEGPIKTATEIQISDRNRLWAMNGEYGRIQYELLAKIIARGVDILQRKGLMPKFKVDGREVTIRYVSPFAKSQNAEDVMALQTVLATVAPLGPQVVNLGIKTEDLPSWVAKKSGLDLTLVRTAEERQAAAAQQAQVMQAAAENPEAATGAASMMQ
jgi:hypothetical protein